MRAGSSSPRPNATWTAIRRIRSRSAPGRWRRLRSRSARTRNRPGRWSRPDRPRRLGHPSGPKHPDHRDCPDCSAHRRRLQRPGHPLSPGCPKRPGRPSRRTLPVLPSRPSRSELRRRPHPRSAGSRRSGCRRARSRSAPARCSAAATKWAAHVAEHPQPRFPSQGAPRSGQGRFGHVVLVEDPPEVDGAADRAAVEQRPRVEDGRVLEVVVSHQGAHPGARRRVRHLLGLAEGHPHGLLAVDVLAGRDGGKGHLAVEGVRSGDGDQIDLRILDESAPIVRRPRKAEPRRRILGLREGDVAEHLQPRARHIAEYRLHRAEGEGVALAHEARADQSDTDAVHSQAPRATLVPRGARHIHALRIHALRVCAVIPAEAGIHTSRTIPSSSCRTLHGQGFNSWGIDSWGINPRAR